MTGILFAFDQTFQRKGFRRLCGIDEVGRGPLFGPVCSAAVILPLSADEFWAEGRPEKATDGEGGSPGSSSVAQALPGLNDSKKLSEKRREALFQQILTLAVDYGIGFADHEEIDRLNILNATDLSMARAVSNLRAAPDLLLIDGNRIPSAFAERRAEAVVKGDGKSASIAAASIVAKVTRDRLMGAYGEKYPAYGFGKHKGYPTKAHYAAIHQHGILPEHRKSFLKNLADHR